MATTTINFENRISGALTAATSVTIHVTRTDTGTDVVVAGTAMSSSSTGVYVVTFTEPELGLTYEVTITVDGSALDSFEVSGDAAAEQLAADTAAVEADKAKILPTASNVLSQFGVRGEAEETSGYGNDNDIGSLDNNPIVGGIGSLA